MQNQKELTRMKYKTQLQETVIRKIYLKYNPEKVSEIPHLLRKYAGSEKELIQQICAKYQVPPLEIQQIIQEYKETFPERPKRKILLWITLIVVLSMICAFSFWRSGDKNEIRSITPIDSVLSNNSIKTKDDLKQYSKKQDIVEVPSLLERNRDYIYIDSEVLDKDKSDYGSDEYIYHFDDGGTLVITPKRTEDDGSTRELSPKSYDYKLRGNKLFIMNSAYILSKGKNGAIKVSTSDNSEHFYLMKEGCD